jgi:hypothetical protein
VQLQRLHLATLLFRFRCSPLRRIHLLYHMCISWQWPASALWITALPVMIYTGHWFGSLGLAVGASIYVLPTALFAIVAAAVASLETKHTYSGRITPVILAGRFGRIVPHFVIGTGMLPHQFTAFVEGLFGPLHSEFERTPKAASVTSTPLPPHATASKKSYAVKVHWPYVLTEAFFVLYHLGWAVLFTARGLVLCAIGATFIAFCVASLCYFYGDHIGKRCFVLDRRRLSRRKVRRTISAGYPTGLRLRGDERPVASQTEADRVLVTVGCEDNQLR